MKCVHPNPSKTKQGSLILLCYWFISNRRNTEIFRSLKALHLSCGNSGLRIVCLNPFNTAEDIAAYRQEHELPFEMCRDDKNTSLYYQISSYPTFLLMENNGRILHRESVRPADEIHDFETLVGQVLRSLQPASPFLETDSIRKRYKNNLSGSIL